MSHASERAEASSPALDYVSRERIESILSRISPEEYRDLARRVQEAGLEREVVFYPSEDNKRPVPIALRPWIFTAVQREYFRQVYLHLESAAKTLYSLTLEDPAIGRLLPLSDDEISWLQRGFPGGRVPVQTIYGRIDATLDPGRADWRDTFKVIEINLSGIGAAYYSFAAGEIARDLIAPLVGRHDPGLALDYVDDGLSLILKQILDHARAIGLTRLNIGFVQDESTLAGPYEFPTIAAIYRKLGHSARVVDPRALMVREGEIRDAHGPLDVLYRDPTIENLIEMERKGGDLSAMKLAFEQNRVVSGLVGELDHKGVLEVLTSERTASLWSPEQRESFRRHIPWTRVLRSTRTLDPEGRSVDLHEYARTHRERLLLKPNRDYGGSGVTFGREASAADWEKALAQAFSEPFQVVVQEAVETYVDRYPVVSGDRVEHVPLYNISGFSGTSHGLATLARMARGRIINITRDGGVAGVLTTG